MTRQTQQCSKMSKAASKEKDISITCRNCGEDFEYESYELAAYLGKRVKIKCKVCNHPNILQITLPLLENQGESETQILNSQVKKRNSEIDALIIEDPVNSKFYKLSLGDGISIIGRKSNNDNASKVVLSDSDTLMSRQHCQINKREINGEVKYTLRDLGSTNGTYLNGDFLAKEEEVFLMPGDTVYIGKVKIKVK